MTDQKTVTHTKPNGAKYVYAIVEAGWDKDKKQPRNKQVCLGRLNEETGEIIPSKRRERTAKRAAAAEVTARSRVVGPYRILAKVAHDTGLEQILKVCFPGRHEHILSLAFFLVQKGLPLSRCEAWSRTNAHPFGDPIPSQRVSELLTAITEDERQSFFRKWMKKVAGKDCLCYDLTSVSSYAAQNEYVRWGHNRDRESLPQINLGMLFGQESGLPVYYRRLPGSIGDVSALRKTVASLDFLGQTRLTFVLDRGFYSEGNIDALFAARMHFILMLKHCKWVDALYDQDRETIDDTWNRRETGENEVLHVRTHMYKWNERRCYVHVYYNAFAYAADRDAFDLKLTRWMNELMSGNENPDNAGAYKKYFIVKETPKRARKVTENTKAVEAARNKYCGFFAIMTTKKMDAVEALDLYRRKEAVENCFDDLKNSLDMNRLRIHSSQAMDSRLFLQFVSLVLLSRVRQIAKQSPALKRLGVREIMEQMETLVEVKYSGRYGSIVTEVDPLQRDIMDAFGLFVQA
jgi:transposase